MSEQKAFKTEVQKLLDLVIHSLYSNKEIFLRELISNASDAIDKARFLALNDKETYESDTDWKIKLAVDKDAKTLTISDNGIGMDATDLENNLGTIASSGTKRFLEELQKNKDAVTPELIGQFGVGFYAAFMVASDVTVITRKAGSDKAYQWTSKGDGFFTIDEAQKESRGTQVIVHLTPENEEFLEEWKIRKTVEKFSNYVEHPVCMDISRNEYERDENGKIVENSEPKVTITEETLNSQKAIWQKNKSEVTKEEYTEFYKHISKDFIAPLETIHWNVEGQTEFKALLFIPEKPIFGMFMYETRDKGVQLYVRRVFITDKCDELVPSYLRFLRGVVDSADLPLNVSREILQEDRNIRLIQKNLVKKVLSTLEDMKEKDLDKYMKFWTSFGPILKEGIHSDYENHDRLTDLLLFDSTTTEAGKKTTLADYVSRMPEGQKDIYYISADNTQAAATAPQLEAFKAKGYEVLFATDNVDEWILPDISNYKDKKLVSVTQDGTDLDSEEEKKEKEEARKQETEDFKDVIEAIKQALGSKVSDVKISTKLTESASCIVSDSTGFGYRMQKMMKAFNPDTPDAAKIMEINTQHRLLIAMKQLVAKDNKNPKIAEYANMLYGEALLTANIPLDNPLEFAKKVSALLADEAEKL